jgi:hypothetical protein
MMARTTAVNMVDAFVAFRSALALPEVGIAFPSKIFLTGASQGGEVAMATMAALEETGDPQLMPDAVAGVAGAYFIVNPDWQNPSADSRVFGLENCLAGDEGLYSIYLSQAVHSYTHWLGGDPAAVLKPDWAGTARTWLDGQHTKFEVYSAWNWEEADPADDILPPAILSPAFLDEYRAYRRGEAPAPWIIEQFARQITVTSECRIPVRLYYGEKDDVAVPAETMAAAVILGPRCQAVSLGRYGHGSTILKAVPEVQAWFAELAAAE